MYRKSMFRNIIIITTLIFSLFFSMHQSSAKNNDVIRVAFPLQQGLTMKDKKGNYYGYDYDYLMQIAQYTGWKYEFVEVDGNINERLTKMMKMLETGELDIMGGMRYNESLAKIYDFPSQSYGDAYNVIAVDEGSDIYDFNTLINKKNLRISALKSAEARIEKLDKFAASNGFTYEKVLCDTQDEILASIKERRADAALFVDLSKPQNYHIVARFSPDPFYFATTKGKTNIVSKLNQALNNIQQGNPSLPANLYNRYFYGNNQSFSLSEKEQLYINEKKTVNVLVRDGNAPIQYIKDQECYGIGKDILSYIEKHSNLKFHYIHVSTYQEYQKAIKEKNIDLHLGLPYDLITSDKLGVSLSNPYLNTNMILIANKSVNPNDIAHLKQGTTHFVNQRYDENKNIKNYDSPEAVLKAIENGEVDYAYLNNYLVTYYLSQYRFKHISTFSAPDYLQSQYAFGIIKDDDSSLINIVNKGIRSSQNEINTYIYKNGYSDNSFDLVKFIQDNIVILGILSLGLVFLILVLVRVYYRRKLQLKQNIEMEYQRYLKLSEVSGEMTFSYDYRLDELKISGSGIHRLSDDPVITDFSKHTDLNSSLDQLQKILKDGTDVYQELEMELLNTHRKWYRVILKVIRDLAPSTGQAVYAVGRILEIQSEVIEREQLRHKSQTDALTGIYNRSGAFDKIKESITAHPTGTFIMMDLDNFKEINDTYGHIVGDQVLRETADMLKQIFFDQIIGRLGGDEFLVFVDTEDETKILTYCESMLADINHLPFVTTKHLSLSMSIGVAYASYSNDIMELMRLSDLCLYQVKRSGRNGYHIYTPKSE